MKYLFLCFKCSKSPFQMTCVTLSICRVFDTSFVLGICSSWQKRYLSFSSAATVLRIPLGIYEIERKLTNIRREIIFNLLSVDNVYQLPGRIMQKRDNLVPSCELCGRNMKGRGRNVVIEGAAMLVCPQCATRFGGQTTDSRQRAKSRSPKQRPAWATGSTEKTPASSPRIQSKRAIRKAKPREYFETTVFN